MTAGSVVLVAAAVAVLLAVGCRVPRPVDGLRVLNFDDFYSDSPDDVGFVEKWRPALELAVMAYRTLNPGDNDDGRNRRSREDDGGNDAAADQAVDGFAAATDDDDHNSTAADALALAASFGGGNATTTGTPSLRRPTDDDHRRCPGAHTTTAAAVDGGGVGGRRRKRQLLPGLFFDETSEHPFIILLQYVVPLISIDLPVLLPPNLRNLDRSKPTLAGAFQAIP